MVSLPAIPLCLLSSTTALLFCCPSPQLFCSAALHHSYSPLSHVALHDPPTLLPFIAALLLCCPSPQLFCSRDFCVTYRCSHRNNEFYAFFSFSAFPFFFCYHLLLINSILLALSVLPVHAGSVCCPPTAATLSAAVPPQPPYLIFLPAPQLKLTPPSHPLTFFLLHPCLQL